MSKEERYKLMLFMLIRNGRCLHEGLKESKSMEEISKMAKKEMEELAGMIDFRRAKELYEMGR